MIIQSLRHPRHIWGPPCHERGGGSPPGGECSWNAEHMAGPAGLCGGCADVLRQNMLKVFPLETAAVRPAYH